MRSWLHPAPAARLATTLHTYSHFLLESKRGYDANCILGYSNFEVGHLTERGQLAAAHRTEGCRPRLQEVGQAAGFVVNVMDLPRRHLVKRSSIVSNYLKGSLQKFRGEPVTSSPEAGLAGASSVLTPQPRHAHTGQYQMVF